MIVTHNLEMKQVWFVVGFAIIFCAFDLNSSENSRLKNVC